MEPAIKSVPAPISSEAEKSKIEMCCEDEMRGNDTEAHDNVIVPYIFKEGDIVPSIASSPLNKHIPRCLLRSLQGAWMMMTIVASVVMKSAAGDINPIQGELNPVVSPGEKAKEWDVNERGMKGRLEKILWTSNIFPRIVETKSGMPPIPKVIFSFNLYDLYEEISVESHGCRGCRRRF
jgi:hypothetical protein